MVDRRKLQYRVAVERLFKKALGHRRRAQQQRANIEPHNGGRQKPRGREYRKSTTDVIGNGKNIAFRITFGLDEVSQRALGSGNRNEQALPVLRMSAIKPNRFGPKDAIGRRRFQRRSGFADDYGAPAFLTVGRINTGDFQQVEEFLQGVVIEAVAGEVNAWLARSGFRRKLVVVARA